jgi:hypothetical protein
MRFIESRPFQFDLTTLAQYKDLFWFGAGYRHLDAISAMAGVQLGVFRLGYAYDFTISDVQRYSSGSHEIFLELQLFTRQKQAEGSTPWYRRNKIYSPTI